MMLQKEAERQKQIEAEEKAAALELAKAQAAKAAEEEALRQKKKEELLAKQRELDMLQKMQDLQKLMAEKERLEKENQLRQKQEQEAKEKERAFKERNELIKHQTDMLKQLEMKKQQLLKDNEQIAQQASSQKSSQGAPTIICLDEDVDISPNKQKMIQQNLKEESSYLPDHVTPEKIEKRKIIKKVRFFDAEEPSAEATDNIQPKVGTKRKLQSNDGFVVDDMEIDEEQEQLQ